MISASCLRPLGDDADPLDVLGPHGHAGDPGVRDQGATNRRHRSEAEAKGEKWERNDRLPAVVTVQLEANEGTLLRQRRQYLIDEIKASSRPTARCAAGSSSQPAKPAAAKR